MPATGASSPRVLRLLIETGKIGPASAVLEVGCGTGNYSIALREATGCSVTGVEPSAEMLAVAQARRSATEFRQGRAEALPVTDASCDLIFRRMRSTMCRIGRLSSGRQPGFCSGGRLCTVTDSPEDIRRRRPLSSHFPESVAIELARYPSVEVLRAEMAAAGFGSIWTETTELPYPLTDMQSYRKAPTLRVAPDPL